jgi:hypothetical protein
MVMEDLPASRSGQISIVHNNPELGHRIMLASYSQETREGWKGLLQRTASTISTDGD